MDMLKEGKIILQQINRSFDIVPIDKIIINPANSRKRTDLSSLAVSIKTSGIIQPIIVRRIEHEFSLISGERRLFASKLAGLREIPAIILECSTGDVRAISMVENMQRKDLSIFEESEAINKFINESFLTKAEIADILCLSKAQLDERLRLLTFSTDERRIVENYNLTLRHATAVLKLQGSAQRISVLEKIVDESLNVRQTEKLVLSLISPQKTQRKKGFVQGDIRLLVNTIDHAVSAMRTAGISATAERRETTDNVEYVIRVPK